MSIRPQPAHIKWPFDEKTAEGIEKNFRTLFQDTSYLRSGHVTPVAFGGTGLTTFAAGDLLYASSVGVVAGLPIDTTVGRFLRTDGSLPEWSALAIPNAATTGDLLYASATDTLSRLADVATGNALISGGVATAPAWGKIGLATHVSGTLPVANGGTGSTTFTAGSVIYSNGTILTQDNSGLFFNATDNRLGVGVASPVQTLDVRGTFPYLGLRTAATSEAAGVAFFMVNTQSSTVQHIGSTYSEVARRNNLELYNLTATGSITLHTANNTTARMTINSAGNVSLTTPLEVASGGSGRASHTAYAVLCGGTTGTAAQQSVASVGTAGQVLTSNGAGTLPTFQAASGTVDEAFVMALAGM